MKHLFLMITFLCVVATSFAQQPDTAFFAKETNFFAKGNAKNEIGIDITPFIKTILDFGGNGGYGNNYQISYKRFFGKNKAFRLGAGGMIYHKQEKQSQSAYQSSHLGKASTFRTRIGLEWRNPFAKRWLFYYGGDFVAAYQHNSNKTTYSSSSGISYEFEDVSNTTIWGLGPVIGFEFALNSRLSLSTEGSLYFMHSHTKENLSNPDEPDSYQKKTNKSSSVNIHVPLSLYINYRF